MYNILVVEDIPAVRNVIMDIIREIDQPLQVHEAASISEMCKMVNQRDWDCIVTDMHLQEGNSLDVIREMRRRGNRSPVILVSGFLTEERRQEAVKSGISHILAKPFQPYELLNILQNIIGEDEDAGCDSSTIRHEVIGTGAMELFAMDRQISILNRMITVASRQEDIHGICSFTLELAMEMFGARKGLISLLDRRKQQLVLTALRPDLGRSEMPGQCLLPRTPYANLFQSQERIIQQGRPGERYECWVDFWADRFIAFPVRLETVPMGVLCLMDFGSSISISSHMMHMLELLIAQLDTQLENRAVHAALSASMKETLIALVRGLEARDEYTKNHSAHVSALSVRLAKNMGYNQEVISLVKTGGLLHDIGKVGIPDSVLLKEGRLTKEEFGVIKTHPMVGVRVLQHMDMLSSELMIVRNHHERWDGHGYPDGLAGEKIPLPARIVGVADAIDAMTTHRCYRKAQSLSFCLEQMKQNSGTQFDPSVASAAINAIECGQVRTQAEEGKVVRIHPVSAII